MNVSMFVGRFTSDPQLSKVGETHVAIFSLAIEEYRKDKKTGERKKRVDFFQFEVWDSGATTIHSFCKKGDQIAVECSAREQKWEVEEDGKKVQRSKVNFRVNNFKLLQNNRQQEDSADE